MSRPIYNVKHTSAVYDISERRIRYLAQLRGIGTKVGGKLLFTKADVQALKPGKNGRPKGSGGHDDGAGSGPIEPQPLCGELDLSGNITASEFLVNSETLGLDNEGRPLVQLQFIQFAIDELVGAIKLCPIEYLLSRHDRVTDLYSEYGVFQGDRYLFELKIRNKGPAQ